MKLTELPELARKAVRANFAVRNARVFNDTDRHSRIRAARRHRIREWIAVLRVLENPSVTASVAKALEDVGPLMAHDLRNRVILAGVQYRLASINGQR